MVECLQKLGAILVKNFRVLQRGWISTFFACFLPFLLTSVLIYLRSQADREKVDIVTKWKTFKPNELPSLSTKPVVAYAPNCSLYNKTMQLFMEFLDVDVVAFENESFMVSTLASEHSTESYLGALVFSSQCSLVNLTYTIRMRNEQDWLTNLLYPKFIQRRPRSFEFDASPPPYYSSGFLAIQFSVDRAIISQLCGQHPVIDFRVSLERMPFPPHLNDHFVDVVQGKLSDIIVLGIMFPILHAIRVTLSEKQKGIKETLKMVGVNSFLYWTSWLIAFLIMMVGLSLILTATLCLSFTKNGSIISLSNPALICLLLILYSFNLLSFGFFLTTLFQSAHTGTALSSAILILVYLPYALLASHYDQLGLAFKLIPSLIPSVGMGFAGMLVGKLEGRGLGAQFSNLFSPASPDDNLCLFDICVCMLCSSKFFMLLTLYVDSVWPGRYGVPKPWYFPFVYLCRRKPSAPVVLDRTEEEEEVDDATVLLGPPTGSSFRRFTKKSSVCRTSSTCAVTHRGSVTPVSSLDPAISSIFVDPVQEAEPVGLPIGIAVRNLCKVYTSKGNTKKIAVSELTMNLFQGQITVLLGHNGAGKTTTLSMLTGLYAPTSGTAFVNGHDIRTDIGGVRKSLGFCPQFDVLFDALTVEEHLQLYARLKGLSSQTAVKEQVAAILTQINLLSKRRCLVGTLSGGMQRRLSIGMALIGSSQVVILDEPTSGLDPEARRQIWDILLKERATRTILVTTHYMDEADHLGDRIAIMAEGRLRCLGSPLYLKAKYGAGYLLTVKHLPETASAPILTRIRQHIPDASLRNDHSEELCVLLPLDAIDRFPALFADLETSKQDLGIGGFGISVTTMEEVFFRVSESECDATGLLAPTNIVRSASEGGLPLSSGYRTETCSEAGESLAAQSSCTCLEYADARMHGCSLYWSQLTALLTKRAIYLKRHRLLVLCQLLIPVVLTCAALFVFRQLAYDPDSLDPRLQLSLDPYGPRVVVPYANGCDNVTSCWTSHSLIEEFLESYTTQFDPGRVHLWRLDNASAYEDVLATQVADPTFSTYISEYIVGLVMDTPLTEVSNNTSTLAIRLFFQGESFHALPVTVNAFSNAVLRFISRRTTQYPSECPLLEPGSRLSPLETFTQPLPLTDQERAKRMDSPQGLLRVLLAGFPLASTMLLVMSFAGASFGPAIVHEYVTKAKHLQFVSGVKLVPYWLSNFVWDSTLFLVICLAVVSVFALFNVDAYAVGSRLHLVLILLLGFAWAILPQMYLLARLFKSPISGLVWLFVINEITGIAGFLITAILCDPTLHQQLTAMKLEIVWMCLSPSFCVCDGLFGVFANYQFRRICDKPWMDLICTLVDPTMPCCLKTCTPFCAYWTDHVFSLHQGGIGRHLCAFAVQGTLFHALVLFMDTVAARRLQRYLNYALRRCLAACHRCGLLSCCTQSNSVASGLDRLHTNSQETLLEDHDVRHHRHLVESMPLTRLKEQACLALRRVTKTYDRMGWSGFAGRCNPAVDRVTLAVLPTECFGLLGVNGAGKTTTFRMITGDLDQSDGLILINGHDMSKQLRLAQQSIGYCPQFDALLAYLTGRETLTFYARLRGLRDGLVRVEVEHVLRELHLTHYADVPVEHYSGGKRRKLSVAVALIGGSPLLCLDEPTTGVDPVSRRRVWNTLIRQNAQGRTVLLSSHSMEECEVLCSRVGIMVNGRLKCLGTCQHLKDRFGRGYSLAIQVNASRTTASIVESRSPRDSESLETVDQDESGLHNQIALNEIVGQAMRFVAQHFPDARLVDRHQGLLQYHLPMSPRGTVDLGRIFGLIEANKVHLNVVNYSVSQTTLEQIFIDLAKFQDTQATTSESIDRHWFRTLATCRGQLHCCDYSVCSRVSGGSASAPAVHVETDDQTRSL